MNNERLPVKYDIKLAYAGSLIAAFLMAVAAAAGILNWSAIYPAPQASSSVGSDAFNLIFILPVLLASMWLAHRGRLIGLLLWPGALFYVLYIYAFYVISLPFNVLFMLYIALVVLSAYTIIGLMASIDRDAVRQRLAGGIPGRSAGGVLIGLAVLFIVMDAYAVVVALIDHTPVDMQTQVPWIIDFIVECPAMLIGGVLLWQRTAPGYTAGAGLLLQIGMLTVGVPISFALGAFLTGSPMDMSTVMLLAIGIIPLALLWFFIQGAATALPAKPVSPSPSSRKTGP